MQQVTKKSRRSVMTAILGSALAVSSMFGPAAAEELDWLAPLLPTPKQPAPPTVTTSPDVVRAPSKECFILGARAFTIPFTVDSAGARPVEVHLYVSQGSGDQWKLLDRKSPDISTKQFDFNAESDGELWFATRTIDSNGEPHPTGKIEPQLKVFVDTTEPSVVIDADADASGRVSAVLKVSDATPLKKIQLRYATDEVRQWRSVDVGALPADGSLDFLPTEVWDQLSLQLVATDTAGNQSVVTKLLRRPRMAEGTSSRFASTPFSSGPVVATPVPYRSNEFDVPPADAPTEAAADSYHPANPVIKLDRKKPLPPDNRIAANGYVQATPIGAQGALGGFRGHGNSQGYPISVPPSLSSPQFAPPQSMQTPSSASTVQSGAQPANDSRFNFAPPRAAAPQQITPAPSQPQMRFTQYQNALPAPKSDNNFGLNAPQQLPESVPPPVAEQRLPRTPAEAMRPMTQQPTAAPEREEIATPKPEIDSRARTERRRPGFAQKSSEKSAMIAAIESIAPTRFSDSEKFSLEYELQAVGSLGAEAVELYGSADNGRTWDFWGKDPDRKSPFDIEVREEGVFSFRIVVVGRNGLASPRPMRDEAPDIVVVVDKTAPEVRVTGAQYGEGDRTGALVIRYDCKDEHLTKRPITLSFSDSVSGPWTTIAGGLRNDGDYVWPADPQLPRQLYLRIDATDQSGNVGTYVLDQPIDARGLAPRARIRGFQSLSGGQFPAANEKTANRPSGTLK